MVLRRLEQSPSARRLVTRGARRLAERLGADRRVLADLDDGGDRPLDRTLQVVQWSLAMRGRAKFPRHFSPGDHLRSAESRLAAAELLETSGHAPSGAQRQLIGLDDDAALTDLLVAIETDVRQAITMAALRPKHGDALHPARQTAAIEAVADALEPIGVRPFLMSGTLLGAIRDGQFMSHDYDVDLGLLPGTDLDAVRSALLDSRDLETRDGDGRFVIEVSEVTVDVFWHVERDDLFWHGTAIHEWWNTPFELSRHRVGDRTFWIPDDPRRYLRENYGEWQEPVPFYDISFDTPNRVYRRNLAAARFLHSRCIQALDRGDRWLLEAATRELSDEFGVDVAGGTSVADSS